MRVNPNKIKKRAKKKAKESLCNYRVVAIGLDTKGRFIGIKNNTPRNGTKDPMRKSFHAEENLIYSCPPNLSIILIGRIGKGGNFLPIDPCDKCKELAEKNNIKIERLTQWRN